MDVGEAVAVDIASEKHDESCYFCNAKDEPATEENDLSDSYPEDEDLDGSLAEQVKFKNDASKLGRSLGGKPHPKEIALAVPAETTQEKWQHERFDVSVAAHHLIPGNASLKESNLFKSEEYLWKEGKAKGNIGYNINAAPNGEWLPGNYGVRPWGSGGASFQNNWRIGPREYAFAAIEAWGAQFHDAHEIYSSFLISTLDEIYDKLEANKTLWCPKAKKKKPNPEERNPLYVLVSRLNTISARMKRMLILPTQNWKKNIYTSGFSLKYMEEKPHLNAAPGRAK